MAIGNGRAFNESHLGLSKAETAKNILQVNNSLIEINALSHNLDKGNAAEIIQDYDVVVDCSDNFPTRYLVNDVCVLMEKPLVFGAISGFEGQVAVFNHQGSGNYRDLYPTMPKQGEVKSCEEGGVLGILAGIIGSLQAAEAVKLITGIGDLLTNKILNYDLRNHHQFIVKYSPSKASHPTWQQFKNTQYEIACAIDSTQVIDASIFNNPAWENEYTLVDVRQIHEQPRLDLTHIILPLPDLLQKINQLPQGKILFICQTGIRSAEAVDMASKTLGDSTRFYSLNGGIKSLLQQK